MEDYVCCRELAQQLDEHFFKGDCEKFFEVWESLLGKTEESLTDPNYDLFLVVDFKLKVYFTVFELSIANGEKKAKKKFANFLQEKGFVYSKFKELAPYFAIPYIENQNHFLLKEILKEEWVQLLKTQWKDFLEKRISHIHGYSKIRLEQQNRKYFNLKAKFTKLKDDHKSLLDLATRLVAALEESIRGDTKCSFETFENYNQQIMIYSHSLLKTNVIIDRDSLPQPFKVTARKKLSLCARKSPLLIHSCVRELPSKGPSNEIVLLHLREISHVEHHVTEQRIELPNRCLQKTVLPIWLQIVTFCENVCMAIIKENISLLVSLLGKTPAHYQLLCGRWDVPLYILLMYKGIDCLLPDRYYRPVTVVASKTPDTNTIVRRRLSLTLGGWTKVGF